LASCCAIGRSSVEATNACRIRAVRAALAARLAKLPRLAGLWLFPVAFFFVVLADGVPLLEEM